ncbi:LOB domain-containing protein 4 [Juglans microcarpa x Juglans regia]|uniref:LOB domain-containing protein 4 n=1 Tax=Juglans microcarpa x Juglans regia TaxID=2249226 RepID=UPI001B7D9D73|nr:LOB domain-containing protein 4 [Juglans microcarpa x Juglans regia]
MKESGRKQGAMSPCAACKLLRRRCAQDCVFAPYFPADEPHKFASVHKVFGASNVNKMLQELPEHQRSDAVSSMVYEANARVRDPVYGCVGAISSLQQQVDDLQTQLALAQAEVVHMKMRQQPPSSISTSTTTSNYPPTTMNSPPDLNNSFPASAKPHHHHHHLPSQTKSFFPMDMVHEIDHQANMGESLWSY